MRAARDADVYRGAVRVGWIERTRRGAIFEYDSAFLEQPHDDDGISTHLPYAQRRFETTGANLHTYFAGLLPEGLRLRALVKRLKASEDDLLTLLVAAGADCIGDVAVVPRGAALRESAPTVDARKLGDVRFADLFAKSIGATRRATPTIPGIQEKISAAMISFPLRTRRRAGSFILKLNPPDKPLLVENEHFFLRMAAACGLDAASATLVHDKDGASGLLVERFDRRFDEASSSVVRVQQEDACQFLDRYPSDKYLVTCAEVAEGLSVCDAPVVERSRLVELIAFSYLIANGDLHAKNVSITRSRANKRVLAPAYDVLTTLPYGDRKMAMKLDGRDDNWKRRSFVEFAKRHGVRERATIASLDELCDAARPWLERVNEIGLDARKTADLRRVMTKRLADLGG